MDNFGAYTVVFAKLREDILSNEKAFHAALDYDLTVYMTVICWTTIPVPTNAQLLSDRYLRS